MAQTKRSRNRRWRYALLVVALAGLVLLTLYLRGDKTAVFLEVAGRYSGVEILELRDDAANRVRLLNLRNHRGEEVASVWLRRPKNLAENYRAVVTYMGQGTGEKILRLLPARDDLVVAAVQYPWRKPETWSEMLRAPYEVRQASYRTVAGGFLAVSHLLEVEEVAEDRIVVIGVSLGSIFGAIHGSLDDRVQRVVIIHGGGDFPTLIRAHMSAPWQIPLAEVVSRVLIQSFDPVLYVDRIAPRRLSIIATRGDHQFPERSTQALYDSARQPKELIWNETPHVRTKNQALVDELVVQIDQLLDQSPSKSQSVTDSPKD